MRGKELNCLFFYGVAKWKFELDQKRETQLYDRVERTTGGRRTQETEADMIVRCVDSNRIVEWVIGRSVQMSTSTYNTFSHTPTQHSPHKLQNIREHRVLLELQTPFLID
jgi:hypothetical protein